MMMRKMKMKEEVPTQRKIPKVVGPLLVAKNLVKTMYDFQEVRKALGGRLQNYSRDFLFDEDDRPWGRIEDEKLRAVVKRQVKRIKKKGFPRTHLQLTRETFLDKYEIPDLEKKIERRIRRFWDLHKTYREMVAQEKRMKERIVDIVESRKPKVVKWLSSIRGIGPKYIGVLVGGIQDISRFDNPAALWKYCGLHVATMCMRCGKYYFESEGKEERWVEEKKRVFGDRIKESKIRKSVCRCDNPIPKDVAPKRKRGVIMEWDPFLKTTCWKIGEQFKKQGDYYRELYDDRKEYEKRKGKKPRRESLCNITGKELARDFAGYEEGKVIKKEDGSYQKIKKKAKEKGYDDVLVRLTDGHIDARAKRYVEKRFIRNLWTVWRLIEDLPIRKPYPVAKGKHTEISPPPKLGAVPEALKRYKEYREKWKG